MKAQGLDAWLHWQSAFPICTGPGLDPQCHQTRCGVLRRWRWKWEDQKFRNLLDYVVSSSPAELHEILPLK